MASKPDQGSLRRWLAHAKFLPCLLIDGCAFALVVAINACWTFGVRAGGVPRPREIPFGLVLLGLCVLVVVASARAAVRREASRTCLALGVLAMLLHGGKGLSA